MVDANLNRAREALRTLEDLARFVLDEAALSCEAKALRHELTGVTHRAFGVRAGLVQHRDTPGDVGTGISAPGERERSSAADVASAAGSRLGEALRVIEEALKIEAPGEAASVERIRYRGYELERRLLPMLARPAARMRLCVLITERLCTHHAWQPVAELAIEGGADGLQLREKDLSDRELLDRARRLVAMTRGSGVRVFVNDRADVAAIAEADGVHLGSEDLSIADARRFIGSHRLIGATCASAAEARAAFKDGADVVGVGPIFASSTKAKPALGGLELAESVASDPELAGQPWVAISGIDEDGARRLARAGCPGVAVSLAVCSAADPREAAARIRSAIEGAGPE